MTQLINSENREIAKQDRSGARTPNDVIRRFPELDKVVIKAGQIEMEGYTSINGGFKIDDEGNMECNNATITNATINDATITNAKIETFGNPNNPSITLKYGEGTERTLVDLASGIIDLQNTITSGGMELVEPQVRLYWGATGDITTLGASGLYTSGEVSSVNGICQGSREEIKKNFEKLVNALDIVKETDIYKYNLIKEKETDKKHIGFVIGENYHYREEITNKENKEADLYSMISVLWQAVKEQQKEIEELKKVIK